jgi:hypothetical protein
MYTLAGTSDMVHEYNTCEKSGRIVIPAWPPTTGTFTSEKGHSNNSCYER